MVAVVWARGGTVDQRCVGLHRFWFLWCFSLLCLQTISPNNTGRSLLANIYSKRFSCTQTEFVDLLAVSSSSPFSVPPTRNSICNGFVFWFCDYETVARSPLVVGGSVGARWNNNDGLINQKACVHHTATSIRENQPNCIRGNYSTRRLLCFGWCGCCFDDWRFDWCADVWWWWWWRRPPRSDIDLRRAALVVDGSVVSWSPD